MISSPPMAYYHDSGLFGFKPCEIEVGLGEEEGFGVTKIDPAHAAGPHRFAGSVDSAALTEWVIQAIANWPTGASSPGRPDRAATS